MPVFDHISNYGCLSPKMNTFFRKVMISFVQKNFSPLNLFIVSLAWKCDETNSELLLRKQFFEILLVQSDFMDSKNVMFFKRILMMTVFCCQRIFSQINLLEGKYTRVELDNKTCK